ncbi:hypothetical protein C8R44DRAFT_755089 [Mycena epipterygia]|nr:hypothetical protein C8R44DRAFT_755089 [Mycena epipterygia]
MPEIENTSEQLARLPHREGSAGPAFRLHREGRIRATTCDRFCGSGSTAARGCYLRWFGKCQIVVKAYESMRDRKAKNDSGYKNTIAQNQLNDVEHRRDIHIANYMARRAAMM